MVEEDVLQLDVSVHDSLVVDISEALHHLKEVSLGSVLAQAPRVEDQVAEVSSRQEVHGDAEEVLVRADFEDSNNIGVVQSRHDGRLSPQVLLDVRILDLLDTNHLESNCRVQDDMLGEFDFAEGSFSKAKRHELIIADGGEFSMPC